MATTSNFVIVTLPRSGSYHLVSLLDSANDVVCHGEILKTEYIELRKFHLDKLQLKKSDIATRDADRLGFVQRLRQINKLKNVGFKIFPGHVNKDQNFTEGLINNPSWLKIFLFRNPLQSYASLLRAKQTGVWVVTHGTTHAEEKLHERVHFTVESFEEHLRTCNWFDGICKKTEKVAGNRVFRAAYDRLADPGHIDQMLGFIGSKSHASDLASKMQKQFSAPFEEGFDNWEEFRSFLHSNKLSHLIPVVE